MADKDNVLGTDKHRRDFRRNQAKFEQAGKGPDTNTSSRNLLYRSYCSRATSLPRVGARPLLKANRRSLLDKYCPDNLKRSKSEYHLPEVMDLDESSKSESKEQLRRSNMELCAELQAANARNQRLYGSCMTLYNSNVDLRQKLDVKMCRSNAGIRKALKDVKKEVDYVCKSGDIKGIFLFVLAHGFSTRGIDYVSMQNTKKGAVDIKKEILNNFNFESCPGRRGVPLICFISACRGTGRNTTGKQMMAVVASDESPMLKDILIVMGSVEDSATTYDKNGSFLIQGLAKFWDDHRFIKGVLYAINGDNQSYPQFLVDGRPIYPLACTIHDSLSNDISTQWN